ncbi:hypothetical protein CF65_01605 [Aggregatibacter actinomycetemcomitans HK1651]|nr:hypothetical protein ANH9381_1307 [Aggregatibacter actinomycetemcomitans ANH9381]AHN71922.1 hypothetical protein CF65_01605 [Aggregatibacter actinomycetemcomitans HK1651]
MGLVITSVQPKNTEKKHRTFKVENTHLNEFNEINAHIIHQSV